MGNSDANRGKRINAEVVGTVNGHIEITIKDAIVLDRYRTVAGRHTITLCGHLGQRCEAG